MAPRSLAHFLGLCNLFAGALLLSAPALLLGDLDGSRTPSARLLGVCVGVLLVAVGSGALRMPPEARRTYLWIFGVAVKVAAALLWSSTAFETGVGALWFGAATDGAVAAVIAAGLLRSDAGRARSGNAPSL